MSTNKDRVYMSAYDSGILCAKLLLSALYHRGTPQDEMHTLTRQLDDDFFRLGARQFLYELPRFYKRLDLTPPRTLFYYRQRRRGNISIWFSLGILLYLCDWNRGMLDEEDKIEEERTHG